MSKVQMRRFIVRLVISLTLGFVALAGLHDTAYGATAKVSTKPSPVGTWAVTVYFNSGANAGQQEQQNIGQQEGLFLLARKFLIVSSHEQALVLFCRWLSPSSL